MRPQLGSAPGRMVEVRVRVRVTVRVRVRFMVMVRVPHRTNRAGVQAADGQPLHPLGEPPHPLGVRDEAHAAPDRVLVLVASFGYVGRPHPFADLVRVRVRVRVRVKSKG